MDFNEKAAARSKYRSTQHLKRVHGGRGRGRGQHAPSDTVDPGLESNYDRYSISDDEEAAEGEIVRQSEGADLEQLLAESEQFYAQAHFRYRSFIETVDLEPPPVDVSAMEQELAIEPELLMQALAHLPLSEFLGLEPQFLVGLDDHIPGSAGLQSADPQAVVSVEQQQHQPGRNVQQRVQQQPKPQQQEQQSGRQQQEQPAARLAPEQQLPSGNVIGMGAKSVGTSATAPAATAVVNDDDVLEQLLQGPSSSAACKTQQAVTPSTSTGMQVAKTAATAAAQQQGTSSSASSTHAGGVPASLQQHTPAAAVGRLPAPAVAAAKAAAGQANRTAADSHTDHELDELLGLSEESKSQATKPPVSAVNYSTAAASRSNKKQSLKDWLDGL